MVEQGVAGAEAGPGIIRVAVFAPYPAVRAGLRAMLEAIPGIEVVLEANPVAIAVADLAGVDVIVGEPGDTDPAQPPALPSSERPVVLLISEAVRYRDILARSGGGLALLSREAGGDEIVAAVRAATQALVVLDPRFAGSMLRPDADASGRAHEPQGLTERETEVLHLMALGLANKNIAARLGISEHTAKFHVGAILGKLSADSRTEAVMTAAKRGWLPL